MTNFKEIFEKYWDALIIGIIAGLVLYKATLLNGNLLSIAFYIFTRGLILILIYSLFVWLDKKYSWDKKFIEFFKNLRFRKIDIKSFLSYLIFLFLILLFSLVLLLIDRIKLLSPLILISSILISSIIILIFYFFNKTPKDSLNLLSLFLFLVTLSYICLLIFISIPYETRGINFEPLTIGYNFYIVNNEISINELQSYIADANKIWNKYNITIVANFIKNVDINLSDYERTFLYTNISNDKCPDENNKICNEEYIPLLNNITDNSSNWSIIFVTGKGTSGRGNLCNTSFAIFHYEKNSWLDLTGWNLAHEIGHTLGLTHPDNFYKINLMTDKHKLFWKSSFLNQTQINIVKDTIIKEYSK